MKKVKVLHFELDRNLGGVEMFLLNLIKHVDSSIIQFEYVTSVDTPALEDAFIKCCGIVHHIANHKNIIQYVKDIKNLIDQGYDVIHIHKNSAANILPIIVCNYCKMKSIFVHSHNTAPSTGKVSFILHRLNKRILTKSAMRRYACSSEAGKWLFANSDFEIMTNGIITSNFIFNVLVRNRKREELGIKESTFVIGHVGRFSTQKNHKFLIEIFEKIRCINSDSKLVLVGEGELLPSIKILIEEKNIYNDVLTLGNRNDIPELMMLMDTFVMPSLYEGLPIVAIEAQASGLDIFLSDNISRETEITDSVTWLNLSQSADSWAEEVLKIRRETVPQLRIDRNMKVKSAGYDIEETASRLQEEYLKFRKDR